MFLDINFERSNNQHETIIDISLPHRISELC